MKKINNNYSKISFAPLWKRLTTLGMSKNEFQKISGLGSSTLTKLRNNNCVTTDTLLKICNVLNCELKDIIELKENSDA